MCSLSVLDVCKWIEMCKQRSPVKWKRCYLKWLCSRRGHCVNSSQPLCWSLITSSLCSPGSIAIIVPLVLLVILIVMVVAGVYICRRRQRYVDKEICKKKKLLSSNRWELQHRRALKMNGCFCFMSEKFAFSRSELWACGNNPSFMAI